MCIGGPCMVLKGSSEKTWANSSKSDRFTSSTSVAVCCVAEDFEAVRELCLVVRSSRNDRWERFCILDCGQPSSRRPSWIQDCLLRSGVCRPVRTWRVVEQDLCLMVSCASSFPNTLNLPPLAAWTLKLSGDRLSFRCGSILSRSFCPIASTSAPLSGSHCTRQRCASSQSTWMPTSLCERCSFRSMWWMYKWPTELRGSSRSRALVKLASKQSSESTSADWRLRLRHTFAKCPILPQLRHRFPEALQRYRGWSPSPQ